MWVIVNGGSVSKRGGEEEKVEKEGGEGGGEDDGEREGEGDVAGDEETEEFEQFEEFEECELFEWLLEWLWELEWFKFWEAVDFFFLLEREFLEPLVAGGRRDEEVEVEAEVEEEKVEEGIGEEGGEGGRLKLSFLTLRKHEAIMSHTGPPWRIQSFCWHSLQQYLATWHRVHARVPNPLSHTQHKG